LLFHRSQLLIHPHSLSSVLPPTVNI
jgi:hypothetical protein